MQQHRFHTILNELIHLMLPHHTCELAELGHPGPQSLQLFLQLRQRGQLLLQLCVFFFQTCLTLFITACCYCLQS